MIRRTRFLILSIALAVAASIPFLLAAEDVPFQPGKAADYANQTSEGVTVGAKAFDTEPLIEQAFKKADMLKYGVLPVLIVVENHRDKSIDLQDLEVTLVGADGRHVTSMNPEDLLYLAKNGKRKPKPKVVPLPLPSSNKNPLNSPDVFARVFVAKLIPPGDSASGFFYFEAHHEAGDTIYLNGMRDARTSHAILYFEFPLTQKDQK